MPDSTTVIGVVDDDASVREGLQSLLRSVGYEVCCFASAEAFWRDPAHPRAACLILDIRMPGMNGLAFQAELARRGVPIPIVFLTGHGDVPMCAQAMRAGAVDFLLKPFREQALFDAIGVAVTRHRAIRHDETVQQDLRGRLDTLTPRERQVLSLVVGGLSNKQAAREIGLSEISVKIHRGNVMRKMRATSFAELVKIATKISDHGAQAG